MKGGCIIALHMTSTHLFKHKRTKLILYETLHPFIYFFFFGKGTFILLWNTLYPFSLSLIKLPINSILHLNLSSLHLFLLPYLLFLFIITLLISFPLICSIICILVSKASQAKAKNNIYNMSQKRTLMKVAKYCKEWPLSLPFHCYIEKEIVYHYYYFKITTH